MGLWEWGHVEVSILSMYHVSSSKKKPDNFEGTPISEAKVNTTSIA